MLTNHLPSLTASNPSNVELGGARLLKTPAKKADESATKAAFQQFVGETFYHMMLKSMRSSQSELAYFHGGQAETMFQGQLDQHLVEQLAENRGASLGDDLYRLFRASQKNPGSSSIEMPSKKAGDIDHRSDDQ